MRKPDVIMAEYLLNGGKMLAKTCPTCNSPLFEVKGRTFCAVCEEQRMEEKAASGMNEHQEQQDKGAPDQKQKIPSVLGSGSLAKEFEKFMQIMLRRAEDETDSTRLTALMQAIKTAAESYAIINQEYGRRDNS